MNWRLLHETNALDPKYITELRILMFLMKNITEMQNNEIYFCVFSKNDCTYSIAAFKCITPKQWTVSVISAEINRNYS